MEIKQKRNKQGFMQKLKEMLLIDDNSTSIKLNDQNNGFKIIDLPYFQQSILPKYFRKPNFASFKRQLHFYNFNYSKNNRCEIIFINDQINFLEEQQVKRKRTINFPKSFDEEINDFRLSLSQIKMNQEEMSSQINLIVDMQKSVNAIIQQSFLFILSNKMLANKRGSKLGIFIERFYKNIKDQKYKQYLRKKYLKEVHETEYAYEQDYFFNYCFHPIIRIPKFTIYFDLPYKKNQLSLKSVDNKQNSDDDESISVSNISNFFNF